MRAYTIPLKDIQRSVTIERVIRFLEIQKDFKEWDLVDGCQLLDKLSFNDSSACTPFGSESM